MYFMDVCVVFISSLRFVYLKLTLVVEFFLFLFKSPTFSRCVYSAFSSMVRLVISYLGFRASLYPGPASSAGHLVKCLQ